MYQTHYECSVVDVVVAVVVVVVVATAAAAAAADDDDNVNDTVMQLRSVRLSGRVRSWLPS